MSCVLRMRNCDSSSPYRSRNSLITRSHELPQSWSHCKWVMGHWRPAVAAESGGQFAAALCHKRAGSASVLDHYFPLQTTSIDHAFANQHLDTALIRPHPLLRRDRSFWEPSRPSATREQYARVPQSSLCTQHQHIIPVALHGLTHWLPKQRPLPSSYLA